MRQIVRRSSVCASKRSTRRQLGLCGFPAVLFQAARDGARLVGCKAADQTHQYQQRGDESERNC